MKPYDHKKIEKKWQKEWDKKKIYQAKDNDKRPKFFGLIEFPFPSGAGMHVGHLRSNTGIDVISRKRRMEGYNVLYPIGWDAFGLPTENYAIKTGVHPKIVTKQNTDNFRKQLKSAGFSFDWSREINTTDPEYYKWTQWIFLEMYKKGLAYKKKMVVNWCPKDKIVLANEEVIDGKCERCGTEVEKREKEQWMLGITTYADRLDKDLDTVDYQEKIKIQQRNWIGRSEGAEISFQIKQENPTTFYQFKGSGKIHEGEPYVEREAIMALVKHWSEDKYLGLRWKKVDWETLVTGGVEKDQTPEQAARTEIEEETGYKNIRLVNYFGVADSRFYHGPKKQNRFGHFHMFVFELENGEQNILSKEEQENHEPVWLSREEVEAFKLPSSHRFLWDTYENKGKPKDFTVKVFTTRPDTIYGATYLVLAPEHPLVGHFIHQCSNASEIDAYVADAKKKDEAERTAADKTKTGVELKGVKAINPTTGEEIPIFISDYVLAHYGTGAVMAVPAHDERDFAFAKKYNLPVKQVVIPYFVDPESLPVKGKPVIKRNNVRCIVKHWKDDTYLAVQWKPEYYGGRTFLVTGGVEDGEDIVNSAIREVQEETGYQNVEYVGDVSDVVHAEYFAQHKDVNRFAVVKTLIFKLKDDAKTQKSTEDQKLHDNVWIAQKDLRKTISGAELPYVLDKYLGNEWPYTGHGELKNSAEFSGMNSEEARNKIAEKFGTIKTTYKLRDWVFSRQRYWGEPIPMVYCEHCASVKQKVLLIHGFEGHAHNFWFPWIKTELEKQGFDVRVAELPDPDHPKVDAWTKALALLVKDFGPHDIIVGHSLGSKAALHLLEKTKKKVGTLYLIASAIGIHRDWDMFRKAWPNADVESLKKFWLAKVDANKASSYATKTIIIRSEDDPFILPETHQDIPSTWDFRIWSGHGHFKEKVIPELLTAIVESKNTGWVPVPEKQLPVKLPEVKNYVPTDTGESPLAAITKWVNTKCPVCGGKATRETDTMPNWAGSSWYYLRYTDPKNKKAFASKKNLDYWTPVDWYNGGMEHTTLHLLYSRFWHKFLFDIGQVLTAEPYAKRTSHGLILAADGAKFSKSKGNGVDPDAIIESQGADALRLYEMFMGPFDQAVSWTDDGIIGPRRFLERVWRMQEKVVEKAPYDAALESLIHQTILKVTNDIEAMAFNTAISSLMILANAMEKKDQLAKSYYKHFLKLLAPFAPHITEEIWANLGNKKSIHLESWDKPMMSKIVTDTTIVVQVNGKVRSEFSAATDMSEEEAVKRAQELPEVRKWTEGKEVKKVIYVKGKLVNIVVI